MSLQLHTLLFHNWHLAADKGNFIKNISMTIYVHFVVFQEETPDEDETFNVVYSLKKVATFYNCHNLGNWGIWDSIFKDISDAKDGNKTLPEEVRLPYDKIAEGRLCCFRLNKYHKGFLSFLLFFLFLYFSFPLILPLFPSFSLSSPFLLFLYAHFV